jgi:2,3-dihydroxyphenylpropionate 1,2-dioxygenase
MYPSNRVSETARSAEQFAGDAAVDIAGICCSHSPLMLGFYEPQDDVSGTAVRNAFAMLQSWVEQYAPELIVVFAPDHYNGFFYDLMPPFCIGVRAEGAADWDIKPGILNVPERIALECLREVHAAGVDAALSWKMTVDHGTTIPLNYVASGIDRYPVLPIVINCVAPPLPSFRRCRLLGEAVGTYLRSLKKRILVIGSGGLSHDPPTPRLEDLPAEEKGFLIDRRRPTKEEYDRRQSRVVRCTQAMLEGYGRCLPPDPAWDREVLERLRANDLAWFDALDDSEVSRVGGHGAHEVRCWIAALSAVGAGGSYAATVECYHTIPEWLTGMGIMRALPAEIAEPVQ